MTILDEILEHKRLEVEQAKARRAPAELALEAKACSRAHRLDSAKRFGRHPVCP